MPVMEFRDGGPASIHNARYNATIIDCRGPYRISGHWWENLWAREEWDIQTKQGDLLRLIREHHHWFLDAAYD